MIVEDTDYPFRDTIRLSVHPTKPVKFPLLLRMPGWADWARITVQGQIDVVEKPGSFHTIEREWKPGDVVELSFPMNLRVNRWYHDGIAIHRGPLVFSLPIGEEWKKVKGDEPHADWEVLPTTPWNYALELDPNLKRWERSFKVEEFPVGDMPFSPEGAPLRLKVKGRRVPQWELEAGSAGPLPMSPVITKGREEDLTLIPYGCTNLRITVFPLAVPLPPPKASTSLISP